MTNISDNFILIFMGDLTNKACHVINSDSFIPWIDFIIYTRPHFNKSQLKIKYGFRGCENLL